MTAKIKNSMVKELVFLKGGSPRKGKGLETQMMK